MNNSELKQTKVGTLTDREIEQLASNGQLITRHFDRNCIKQACYELRASNIYYDLPQEAERVEVGEDSYILIKPRQVVVIIAHEVLSLPNDVLARILTKGKLFSIGLLPVNTYADPGFIGQLGIVFFNSSTNYLKIKPGEPIAKIEFNRLEHPVAVPYHGQHGYQTSMWPIPTEMILTEGEIRSDSRILDRDRELALSYGKELPAAFSRMARVERPLIILSCGYFTFSLLLMIAIAKEVAVPVAIGVGAGIVANILTTFVTLGATDYLRRRR